MSHPDNSWQTWGFPSWIGKLPYGTGWITLDFSLIIHNQHNHAYDLTYDLNYNLGRVEGEAWSEEDKEKDIDIDDINEHDNVKS